MVAGGEDGVHFTLNRFTDVWNISFRHNLRSTSEELILIVLSKGREGLVESALLNSILRTI